MDLTSLTPDQLVALKAQLDALGGDALGRSPVKPRQLHDLRLLPTADDPRPTFFWSATSPRDAIDLGKTTEFPKLLWHEDTGREITVTSQAEQADRLAHGYVRVAPAAVVLDPVEALRAQFEALPPEDRAAILEAEKRARLGHLQAQLSALTADQLAALIASAPADSAETPEKRSPGRPRKDTAA